MNWNFNDIVIYNGSYYQAVKNHNAVKNVSLLSLDSGYDYGYRLTRGADIEKAIDYPFSFGNGVVNYIGVPDSNGLKAEENVKAFKSDLDRLYNSVVDKDKGRGTKYGSGYLETEIADSLESIIEDYVKYGKTWHNYQTMSNYSVFEMDKGDLDDYSVPKSIEFLALNPYVISAKESDSDIAELMEFLSIHINSSRTDYGADKKFSPSYITPLIKARKGLYQFIRARAQKNELIPIITDVKYIKGEEVKSEDEMLKDIYVLTALYRKDDAIITFNKNYITKDYLKEVGNKERYIGLITLGRDLERYHIRDLWNELYSENGAKYEKMLSKFDAKQNSEFNKFKLTLIAKQRLIEKSFSNARVSSKEARKEFNKK